MRQRREKQSKDKELCKQIKRESREGVLGAEMAEEELPEEEVSREQESGVEQEQGKGSPLEKWLFKKPNQALEVADKLIHGDVLAQTQAARDIRSLVRSCSSSASSTRTRSRLVDAGVVPTLVSMLSYVSSEACKVALLALLNLAVRNERNKIIIVESGAVPPIVNLLNGQFSELATAAILTLSCAEPNKPILAEYGVPPLLIQSMSSGNMQGRVDAVTALYNISTGSKQPTTILNATAAPALISLLKDNKKYTKFAEKSTALLEILSSFEEGRSEITNARGGILTLVETVEEGSLVSMEHAVGALLSLCLSCRSKYRELILNEGPVPGLLRLTAEGTPKSQEKARTLLDLLRDSSKDKRMSSSTLQEIVYDIATKVDGVDKAEETAKKLLQDMVHRSMEHSMKCLQVRAASCIPSDSNTEEQDNIRQLAS